jgi:TPR repeat protein
VKSKAGRTAGPASLATGPALGRDKAPADSSQLPTYELIEPMFAEAPAPQTNAAALTSAPAQVATAPAPVSTQSSDAEAAAAVAVASAPSMATAALPSQPVPPREAAQPDPAPPIQGEAAGDSQMPTIDLKQLAVTEDLILARVVKIPTSGILQPLVAAFGMLEGAAARGDPGAAYDVGHCYENGIGVKADPVRVYVYYIRSAGGAASTAVRTAAFSGAQSLIGSLTDEQYKTARNMLQTGAP